MDASIRSKTPAEAAAYREQLRQASAPAVGTFKHWPTEAARQEHLAQVKQSQESGLVPF